VERILKKVKKEVKEESCKNCSCDMEIDESLKPLLSLKKKDLVKIIQMKNDLLIHYINKEKKT
jgi:hypothetical protein